MDIKMLTPERNWDILLIGGSSGSGKTKISVPLARFYGIDLVRVDDFQVLLEKLTTPENFSPIHYWNTHPEWMKEEIESTVRQIINVGRALIPGLIAVIKDHRIENIPMILEGDFILPELSKSFEDPRIKSFFLYEPSKEQILQNFLKRDNEIQQYRADVSHYFGNWLAKTCRNLNIPVIESQPWDSLMDRVIESMK